jgi:hypothetical protein
MTREAKEFWRDYYVNSQTTYGEDLRRSMAARSSPHIFRAAGRLAAIENESNISLRHLEIAVLMQEYSSRCIDFIFGEYINEDAEYVTEFIKATNKGTGVTWSDLFDWAMRHKLPKNQIKRTVTGLLEEGQLKRKTLKPGRGTTGGRPRQVILPA